MKLARMISAAAVMPLVLAAGSSQAQMHRAAPLEARLTSSTIRGDFRTLSGYQNHVWRLAQDGTVEATYTKNKIPGVATGTPNTASDSGTWWISGRRLCVDFDDILRGNPGCFDVQFGPRQQIELSGPVIMTGTIKPGIGAQYY